MSQHCVKTAFSDKGQAQRHINRMKQGPPSHVKKASEFKREPYQCPKCGLWHITFPALMGHPNTRAKEAVH